MGRLQDDMEERLEPGWGAAVAGICALYGLWPGIILYKDLVAKSGGGYGEIPFVIYSAIGFVLTMAVVVYPLSGILCVVESALARAGICLAMAAVFVFFNGFPHPAAWILIASVAVSSFVSMRRRREDDDARRDFLNE